MATDWIKQSQEMVNNWTTMQMNVWNTFFDSIDDMRKSPSEQLWDQTISAGQQAIKNTFDAQQEIMRNWVNYIKGIEGVPGQVVESAEQYQNMSEHWLETQRQLWANWIEMFKNFDFSKMTTSWGASGAADPMKVWQDSSQKIMEVQAEWMRAWINAFSVPGDADEK